MGMPAIPMRMLMSIHSAHRTLRWRGMYSNVILPDTSSVPCCRFGNHMARIMLSDRVMPNKPPDPRHTLSESSAFVDDNKLCTAGTEEKVIQLIAFADFIGAVTNRRTLFKEEEENIQ